MSCPAPLCRTNGKPASLLLIEPAADGHHAVWLRWISDEMTRRGWRVRIATSEEALRAPSLSWLIGHSSVVDVVTVPGLAQANNGGPACNNGRSALLWKQMQWYGLLKELYRRARAAGTVDVVLLPYGDYILHPVAMLGSPFGETQWAAILMRPTFHYRAAGVVAPPQSF